MKKYYTESRVVRCTRLGGQLVSVEKRAFGWDLKSATEKTEYSVNGGDKLYKVMKLLRHKPYTDNVFFNIVEWLANVFSAIRVWALKYIIPVLVTAIAITLLESNKIIELGLTAPVWIVIGVVYGVSISVSMLLALVGKILKDSLHLEEKLMRDMERNGYDYERYADV